MSECSIYVNADWITVWVDLPEEVIADEDGEPTTEAVERAKSAILAALPQRVEIFLDGEDKAPAVVRCEPWGINADDTKFRVE